MKKVLLVLLVLFAVLLLFGCDDLSFNFTELLELNTDSTDVSSSIVNDDPQDLFSGELAQALLDNESEFQKEVEGLNESHPEYTYSFIPVDTVQCHYYVNSNAIADDVVEKHNMNEVFYKGEISSFNKTKIISITFDRDDFTQKVYDEIYRIAEDKESIYSIHIYYGRGIEEKYIPKIEHYAPNATPVSFNTTSSVLTCLTDDAMIVRSKEEYETYINQITNSYNSLYINELIEAEKDIFTKEFFDENVLVITEVFGHGSSSVGHRIDNVYVLNNKLYVAIETMEPNVRTSDIVNYCFQLIVSKSDMESIDEIIALN